jgi:DNA-binding helix-hairpin-helix protein with protein kinase domain
MKSLRVSVGGRPLELDRLIGKGGEGEVYQIAGNPTKAVKLYTTADRLSRESKISAMVQAELAKHSPLAAFPLAVVHRHDGTFAGFVMRLVGNHRPIHELYAPGSRKHHFPQADYRFLARAATNIAKAFASVHRAGCVVGDINHSGVLVSPTATAALIDADSFQFTVGGRQFLCSVGVPEYTPPELQGKSLQGVVRTTDHDAFGLAVVLFQMLLMGRHPFVGRVRRGEMPPLEESIRDFRYVYAEDRDVGMDQPPGTPALSDFSPELAALFSGAFSKGSLGQRPSAHAWVSALEQFESSLIQCADNALHFGPKDASECPWCAMEEQLQTFLFLPYFGGTDPAGTKRAPSPAGTFNLQLVWARIERVQVPQAEQLRPTLAPVVAEPSPAARAASEAKEESSIGLGVLLLIIAVGLGVAAPGAWVIAIVLGLWGMSKFKTPAAKPVNPKPFRDEFVSAKTQWYQELEGWRRRVGLTELNELRLSLAEAKERYAGLAEEERRQTQQYRTQRRDRQLHAYLEGFDVARANIKGIGHAKLAALASYGIDTAADVRFERVMNVPGFGEALSKRLVEWRRSHEARFVLSTADNEADRREIARIQALIEGRAAPLRVTLTHGAQELETRLLRVQEFSRRPDPVLYKVHERVERARKDLAFLSIQEPAVSPPSPPPARRGATSSPSRPLVGATASSAPAPSGNPSRGAGSPRCPKCGSGMCVRVAKKGRYSGQQFWGCSRFPSCKGTTPI